MPCVGEKNVTDLTGEEVAVIDHHQVTPAAGLWYEDIRPDYGATATIIYEYYQQLGLAMPVAVATALQVGLNIDTANLTRGFCEADVETVFAAIVLNPLSFPTISTCSVNCGLTAEWRPR
jgi:nanoRNase/pAp phosphatase (c-di-AMP/oligoRNAs hydrolase)